MLAAGAALPWSAITSKRIWERAWKNGLNVDDAIEVLAAAERHPLGRGKICFFGN